MEVYGSEIIEVEVAKGGFFLKCLVTESDAVFFPESIQHRDMKIGGVSYEDDYKGNALAATITPGTIDVRFHERYDDARVKRIFDELFARSEVSAFLGFRVRYQGRVLIESES